MRFDKRFANWLDQQDPRIVIATLVIGLAIFFTVVTTFFVSHIVDIQQFERKKEQQIVQTCEQNDGVLVKFATGQIVCLRGDIVIDAEQIDVHR